METIQVTHKIVESTPDEVCLECSQYWEGECRAYEFPHSLAESESRRRDNSRMKCLSRVGWAKEDEK